MHRPVRLLLTLLALAFGGNAALADGSGRWGVRLEYPLEAVAFVEVVAWQVLGFEVGAGVEVAFDQGDPLEVTPYSVLAFYREAYWLTAEIATPVQLGPFGQRLGFAFALAFGGRF